jgi:hypothetical protein
MAGSNQVHYWNRKIHVDGNGKEIFHLQAIRMPIECHVMGEDWYKTHHGGMTLKV